MQGQGDSEIKTAFYKENWRLRSRNDKRRSWKPALFSRAFLTAGKQIIAEDQAADNDNESQQPMSYKQHDRHADPDPEQDKTNQSFQWDILLFNLVTYYI